MLAPLFTRLARTTGFVLTAVCLVSRPAAAIDLDCSDLAGQVNAVKSAYMALLAEYPLSHVFVEECLKEGKNSQNIEGALVVCGGICALGDCWDYVTMRVSLETRYQTIVTEMQRLQCT